MGIVSDNNLSLEQSRSDSNCSSTRNTRIERIWVEVGRTFARRWRGFFYYLEKRLKLDVTKPAHLWLLNILFLEDIDKECQTFIRDWNYHQVTTERNQLPHVHRLPCLDTDVALILLL
jgi:hypothetical protein